MEHMQELYNFMHLLAQTSGELIRRYYQQKDFRITVKDDKTVVTEADRDAESLIREKINKNYPGHGIIGEEFGSEKPGAEFVWILDPIDGTISFIHGVPLFGTLIGLLHKGKPILGCIHQPILQQLCLGHNNETTLNGKAVRMRENVPLENATILTTDFLRVGKVFDDKCFQNLCQKAKTVRTWGDCYGYLLLASGFADVMLDPRMNPWDLLPLIPVMRGAGATISTWTGGDISEGQSCIAAAPHLHKRVVELLNNTAVI